MLQMSGISAKLSSWESIGWSPSWPRKRDIGIPGPTRVPVVNFTYWELTVGGAAEVCYYLTAAESPGRRFWPASPKQRGTVGHRGSSSSSSSIIIIPTCLHHLGPSAPPQKHHEHPQGSPLSPAFIPHRVGQEAKHKNGAVQQHFGPFLGWKVAWRRREIKPLGLNNFPF